MEKERILIVDDEPAIRALVEQIAAGSGYVAREQAEICGKFEYAHTVLVMGSER